MRDLIIKEIDLSPFAYPDELYIKERDKLVSQICSLIVERLDKLPRQEIRHIGACKSDMIQVEHITQLINELKEEK